MPDSFWPALLAGLAPLQAADFDLALHNGRVMNSANGLDSVRDVGIRDGRIADLSREPLSGKTEVNAAGLVVASGYIDLHAHGRRSTMALPSTDRKNKPRVA